MRVWLVRPERETFVDPETAVEPDRSPVLVPRLSRNALRSRIAASNLRTGTEVGSNLAGVFDNVVATGQTQEHAVSLRRLACHDRATRRAPGVPREPRMHDGNDLRSSPTIRGSC